MPQDGELARLEQVVGKLLDSHQALQRRCQELEGMVREREQSCSELQQEVTRLNGERSQVASRVQGLLERIDRWQVDGVAGRTAAAEESGQGTLFALSN